MLAMSPSIETLNNNTVYNNAILLIFLIHLIAQLQHRNTFFLATNHMFKFTKSKYV